MNNKKEMKNITVTEFLEKTKGKKYHLKCSDISELVTEIEGNNISDSIRMDTVEQIVSCDDGSFVLDYGERMPRYTFREIVK